ncbi:hypothetical protein [Streptomyces sp. S.PB5]|uniref:hypothetical protein n=1 Tax=Streptomyces sp. S.PB5 TaxID=3020844 RepID=UPI0025B00B0D|nr:hypothetical protein [Streptomyces sp. S.PB5]MDN3023112.1 hypothetical protein [Streptomyces sp. S.PB5]
MSEVREVREVREARAVMPIPARAVQILLYALSFIGIVSMLALSDRLTAYGQGELMASWLPVWVCAALATTYEGRARTGVRTTTVVLMTFTILPTFMKLGEAAAPAFVVDAALRIVLGAPVVVLLFLPETTAWFDRER